MAEPTVKRAQAAVVPPAEVKPETPPLPAATEEGRFPVATLTEEEGPYLAGQAITTDPEAPWEKGHSPKFLEDEARMKAWRAAGKPLFVDPIRFEAWSSTGALKVTKEVTNGG